MHQLLKKRDHDRAMGEVSIGRVEGATESFAILISKF